MKCDLTPVWLCGMLLAATAISAPAASIEDAREDIARLRYQRAEQQLVEFARSAHGEEKQEALFLLAGLKSSVTEAQIIYEEVIAIEASNDWGENAQIELAKIQYAVGDYNQALDILHRSSACRHSEEACYFEGLSAVMLERYGEARESLSRVRRGDYRPWAYLALAEIDSHTENAVEACRKYRAMARSGLSPTAMYRYGECLETEGDREEATVVFESIVREFGSTPEAVLAAQKLAALATAFQHPSLEPKGASREIALESGFTLQFGAFYDRGNAIKLMAELKRMVNGVRVDSDLVGSKEIHRVRVGYFATRAEAQHKADELRRQIDDPISIMTLP
jgi:TolA-binding protein